MLKENSFASAKYAKKTTKIWQLSIKDLRKFLRY
jgi:hypothetical protein